MEDNGRARISPKAIEAFKTLCTEGPLTGDELPIKDYHLIMGLLAALDIYPEDFNEDELYQRQLLLGDLYENNITAFIKKMASLMDKFQIVGQK